MITKLDFIGVPSTDSERTRAISCWLLFERRSRHATIAIPSLFTATAGMNAKSALVFSGVMAPQLTPSSEVRCQMPELFVPGPQTTR